jgi:threonine dehydratase
VDDIVAVREDQTRDGVRRIASEARLIAEPSGAVALAGAIASGADARSTVAIVSGGNVDPAMLASILTG